MACKKEESAGATPKARRTCHGGPGLAPAIATDADLEFRSGNEQEARQFYIHPRPLALLYTLNLSLKLYRLAVCMDGDITLVFVTLATSAVLADFAAWLSVITTCAFRQGAEKVKLSPS